MSRLLPVPPPSPFPLCRWRHMSRCASVARLSPWGLPPPTGKPPREGSGGGGGAGVCVCVCVLCTMGAIWP